MNITEILDYSPEAMAKYSESYSQFQTVADRYKGDADFRTQINSASGAEVFSAFGFDFDGPVDESISVKILVDSDTVSHLVLPPDPNTELLDEKLMNVSGGGKCAGSAGSVSTASTIQCSTLPSSMSSGGTAGTVGSGS